MMDQLSIGTKASYDDFQASIASRKLKMPKKKSIKETVPFSNVTYDFSAIGGEVYWEERVLEYVFEITAETPEKLEELKTAFINWVASVQEEELHDPFYPDHHFLATYDDLDPEDDEGLDKCTLTVTFTAYPYKLANVLTGLGAFTVEPGDYIDVEVRNPYARAIVPTFVTDGDCSVFWDGFALSLRAGSTFDRNVKLQTGTTTLSLENYSDAPVRVEVGYREEVL